jgi:hypothetical protein
MRENIGAITSRVVGWVCSTYGRYGEYIEKLLRTIYGRISFSPA